MPVKQIACPICDSLCEYYGVQNYNIAFYECSLCGSYAIGHETLRLVNRDILAPFLFYNWNLNNNSSSEEHIFYYIGEKQTYDIMHKEYPNSRLITIENVNNWYPKNFSEKIDYILLGIYKLSEYTGKSIFMIGSLPHSLLFTKCYKGGNKLAIEDIDEQVEYYLSYMVQQNLIKQNQSTITLLPVGLKRIDDLQKNQSISKQAFIAIAFSDDMKEIQEAIEKGIRKAGYIPLVMNKTEHNNQIVPEILYQIKQSKFVVAEFSTNNNDAYYEAGYAAGLGKEVIHICNDDKFREEGHFDIKQKSTVLWKTIDDIPEALFKRIEATIGKGR